MKSTPKTASVLCLVQQRLPQRHRQSKRNAELRAFKKEMEIELTLADIEKQEQVAKAERDRQRRRAEMVIWQATLESELEIAQARQKIEEAVTDRKSTMSRVQW